MAHFMNLAVNISLYYLSRGWINNVVEKRGGFCGLELLSKTRLKSLMHFWVSLWPALPFYLMLSNTKLLVWQGEIWISFISSIVVEKNFVLWSFGSYHLSLLWKVSRLVLGDTVLHNSYFSLRSHLKFPKSEGNYYNRGRQTENKVFLKVPKMSFLEPKTF